MKQVEKVWAELSAKAQEVELSENEKIELSALDDVRSAESLLERAIQEGEAIESSVFRFADKLEDIMLEGKETLKTLQKTADLVFKNRKEGIDALNEFEKLSSEIGMDPNGNSSFSNLNSLVYQDAERMIARLQDFYDKIKGSVKL